MVQSEAMAARERVFTIRLSNEEAEMAERVAKSFSLPIAGLFRMLVKKEDDRLELQKQIADDSIELEEIHEDVLYALADGKTLDKDAIQSRLCDTQHGGAGGRFYMWPPGGREIAGLGRALNELKKAKYIRRLTTGYVLTDKGKVAANN